MSDEYVLWVAGYTVISAFSWFVFGYFFVVSLYVH